MHLTFFTSSDHFNTHNIIKTYLIFVLIIINLFMVSFLDLFNIKLLNILQKIIF